jgi:hypothetical protein
VCEVESSRGGGRHTVRVVLQKVKAVIKQGGENTCHRRGGGLSGSHPRSGVLYTGRMRVARGRTGAGLRCSGVVLVKCRCARRRCVKVAGKVIRVETMYFDSVKFLCQHVNASTVGV